MKKTIISVLATMLFLASCKTKQNTENNSSVVVDSNFVTGEWVYRSLLNNPDDTVQFNNLEFAVAIMKLKRMSNDSISGILDMGDSGILNMKGFVHYCDGITAFEIRGTNWYRRHKYPRLDL